MTENGFGIKENFLSEILLNIITKNIVSKRKNINQLSHFNSTRYVSDTNFSIQGKQAKTIENKVITYQLYLPLYNSLEWLEIGVPEEATIHFLALRNEKPIVVYGSSITQGACASRPGMAWTAILERKMDRPLLNFGFSGNGRLEKELIDLISEIDAKIFVLDCLPNLKT